MLSSRIAAAAFGVLALAGATFAAAPADAAPVSAAPVPAAQAETGLVQEAWHRGRPHYGPRRYYGPRRFYGRPIYRPRCFVTNRRVWTGYGWVVRRVRVCR